MNKINEYVIDFEKNKIVKICENFYLTNYQIELLKMYNINCYEYSNYNSLTRDIDEILLEDYSEDLDEVLQQITEFNYYHNTNK